MLSEFYKDRRTPSGLKSQCKPCHTAGNIRTRDVSKARDANRDYMRRARDTNPEKFKERERSRAPRLGPKTEARNVLNAAVRAGKLVRSLVCGECGADCITHGHHEDYAQPLVVEWLCSVCHGRRHRHM